MIHEVSLVQRLPVAWHLFDRLGVTDEGKVQGRFRSSGERPAILDRLKVHGIELPHSLFEEVVDVNL